MPGPSADMVRDKVYGDLAKLDPARKDYQQYYRRREANDNLRKAPQGIHAFLRAYYHFKSADWKQNKPFKLASFTAGEATGLSTTRRVRLRECKPLPVPDGVARTWSRTPDTGWGRSSRSKWEDCF